MSKHFLENLLYTPTPSGYESACINLLSQYAEPFAKHEFTDKVGNVAFSVGEGDIKIMLSGHIDEIAMQVQNVDDNGFVHFIKDGGIDEKVLLGSSVLICSTKQECDVLGVIGKKPIHVEYHTDEKDKVTKVKDMKIDIGAESKEEALSMINIGDPIVFNVYPNMNLGKNRFTSNALDDKVGVYVTFEVLKELSKYNLKHVKVYGVACTQEETSASGAVGAATKIDPQYSIDYDVTFATDDDYVSPNEWGDIKLGKGGAIAYGVDSNNKLAKFVKGICDVNSIPYQEFSVGSGGTDTVHIKQSSTDCYTLLLSIPNRNMHTQVEVCDYRDLDSLIKMTVASILKIEENASNGITDL